jgi:hypothetical protein
MNQNYELISRRSFLNLTGTGGMALVTAVMGSALWNTQPPNASLKGKPPYSPSGILRRRHRRATCSSRSQCRLEATYGRKSTICTSVG